MLFSEYSMIRNYRYIVHVLHVLHMLHVDVKIIVKTENVLSLPLGKRP